MKRINSSIVICYSPKLILHPKYITPKYKWESLNINNTNYDATNDSQKKTSMDIVNNPKIKYQRINIIKNKWKTPTYYCKRKLKKEMPVKIPQS